MILRPNTQFQTTSPQNSHKPFYTSTWRKSELNRLVEPFFEKCRSLPLMCLEYNKGSVKTQSMMHSSIGLPRFSNSLPLKCNVHKITKRSFVGYNVGLR